MLKLTIRNTFPNKIFQDVCTFLQQYINLFKTIQYCTSNVKKEKKTCLPLLKDKNHSQAKKKFFIFFISTIPQYVQCVVTELHNKISRTFGIVNLAEFFCLGFISNCPVRLIKVLTSSTKTRSKDVSMTPPPPRLPPHVKSRLGTRS